MGADALARALHREGTLDISPSPSYPCLIWLCNRPTAVPSPTTRRRSASPLSHATAKRPCADSDRLAGRSQGLAVSASSDASIRVDGVLGTPGYATAKAVRIFVRATVPSRASVVLVAATDVSAFADSVWPAKRASIHSPLHKV